MKKIVVFVVYFGKLPNYFSLFLLSVKYNPTIDFIIITDNYNLKKDYSIPKNVSIKYYKFEDIQKKINDYFKIESKINRPYKLCDIKPMYGVIFGDLIKKYDFWGYCDIDLIFGNIRNFITNEILNNYDKIYILGHFSLLRNTSNINKLFMFSDSNELKSGNYRDVLMNDKICGFDEWDGMYEICKQCKVSVYHKVNFIDLWTKYTRYRIAEIKLARGDLEDYPYQAFYWENGSIFRTFMKENEIFNEEFIYIHHLPHKKLEINFCCDDIYAFWISPKGFFKKQNTLITLKEIKKYNPFYGFLLERIDKHINELRKKIF